MHDQMVQIAERYKLLLLSQHILNLVFRCLGDVHDDCRSLGFSMHVDFPWLGSVLFLHRDRTSLETFDNWNARKQGIISSIRSKQEPT